MFFTKHVKIVLFCHLDHRLNYISEHRFMYQNTTNLSIDFVLGIELICELNKTNKVYFKI